MTLVDRHISAAEFMELPESPPGERLELVKGEIVVSPRPTLAHAHTALMLGHILLGYIEQNQLGSLFPEVDTVLDEDEMRIPDLIYYAKHRAPGKDQRYADTPPDLCIELLSPSNARVDRIDKFKLYESKGVANYWIVDPEARIIEAFSLENGRYIPSGRGADDQIVQLPPFPELAIPLGRLWRK